MQELHQACVCFCDVLQHLVCNAKAPQPAQFPLLVGALEGFQLGIHLENMYFIISARHPPERGNEREHSRGLLQGGRALAAGTSAT